MEILKSLALILTLVAAAVAGLFTIAGGGDGVWEHVGVVQVRAPRDRVFEWLTEPKKRREWVVGMVSSEADPHGRLSDDSRLKESVSIDGVRFDQTLEITEFEEGTRFSYRTMEGDVAVEMHYDVRIFQSGQRSRIDFTCKATYPGWTARVFEPIFGHYRLARIEESLDQLKLAAEGDL